MYIRTKNVSNWKQINYRNVDSMLSVQFIYDLYDQHASTINWFRFKNVCLYFQDNKLWSFTPQDEWEKVITQISKQFRHPKDNSNPDIVKNCYWYYERKETLLEEFLKKKSKVNLKRLSNEELYDLLFNWYQITLNQIYYINLAPVELGLQRAIADLKASDYLTNDEISILYSLDDNTAVIREEYAFLMALKTNKGKSIKSIIKNHLKEYSYVTIGYGSSPLNEKVLLTRYEKIKELEENYIDKRIKEIEKYPQVLKKQKREIYKKLNNKQLANLFELAAKLGFMRDRKKAFLGKSVQFRNTIMEEISRRFKIDWNDIRFYLMNEFEDLLLHDRKLECEEIEKRKQGIYISSISNMFTGGEAREEYFQSVKTEIEDTKVLNTRRGICASHGVVRGKARICLTFEESNKLEKGEILIAYGTDFDFMNAIVKSSGIITEEGGILSHASVISRELKKPCIIAFKGITKLVKDGDLIELDAEKGTVKLLEKSQNKTKKILGIYHLTEKVERTEVGNKAYNLAELAKFNSNVPDAYFLGISFFKNILEEQGKLAEYVKCASNLNKYKEQIYKLIDETYIDPEIFKDKLDFDKNTYAVRSSSPNEDSDDKSFAGQYITELFCNSIEFTINSIKKCWKSLLGVHLDKYKTENNDAIFGGIVVQKMVNADFSGVMFTKNPVSNNKDCIVIECVKGVADKLVDNRVVPDRFFVNQEKIEIIDEINRNNIPHDIILKLAELGQNIEKHYGCEVDIEWAYESGILYLIQCRPITT